MRFLPVGLDTEDKKILIIGGGYMALSIVKTLLDTEAAIYLIGDEIMDEIKQLAQQSDRLKIKEETVTEDFVFLGYDMLFLATHNFELNNALELRARNRHMLYERLDILSCSSMSVGKVIEQGPLTVGIHCSKTNPTFTEMLEKDIRQLLQNKYPVEKLNILNDIRHELVRKNASHIDEIISSLFQEEVINIHTFKNSLSSRTMEEITGGQALLTHIQNKDFGASPQEEQPSSKENSSLVEEKSNPQVFPIEKEEHNFLRTHHVKSSDSSQLTPVQSPPFYESSAAVDIPPVLAPDSREKEESAPEISSTDTTAFLNGQGLRRTFPKDVNPQESSHELHNISAPTNASAQPQPVFEKEKILDQQTLSHTKDNADTSPISKEDEEPISHSNPKMDRESFSHQTSKSLSAKKENSTWKKPVDFQSLRERLFPSKKKETTATKDEFIKRSVKEPKQSSPEEKAKAYSPKNHDEKDIEQ